MICNRKRLKEWRETDASWIRCQKLYWPTIKVSRRSLLCPFPHLLWKSLKTPKASAATDNAGNNTHQVSMLSSTVNEPLRLPEDTTAVPQRWSKSEKHLSLFWRNIWVCFGFYPSSLIRRLRARTWCFQVDVASLSKTDLVTRVKRWVTPRQVKIDIHLFNIKWHNNIKLRLYLVSCIF